MGNIFDLINIPLAFVLKACYFVTNNYGLAIILFAVIAKLLLLPIAIKGEKGRRKMAKFQPKVNAIQAKYKGNTKDPKYNEELQSLYQEEGYSPMAGCLPQLIQLPLIMGLWNAIRNPLTYISGIVEKNLFEIVTALQAAGIATLGTWPNVNQIAVVQAINTNPEVVEGILPEGFKSIGMNFLGLNLGDKPQMAFHITVLIPIVSALTSFLVGYISSKINKTSSKTEDPTQKNMNFILYFMPLISLWMGFTFEIGIGLYWIVSNVLNIAQTILLPKLIKETVVEVKVKEKKLNYNQIAKLEAAQKEEKKENND